MKTNFREKQNANWLTDIPSHWTVIPFKFIFEICKTKNTKINPTILSLTQNGLVERDISGNEGQLSANYEDGFIARPGEFVLNPMDLRSGSVAVSELEGVVSGAYYVFRSNGRYKINNAFYENYFRWHYLTDIFYSHGSGIGRPEGSGGRWTISRDTLLNFPVALPPYEEQVSLGDSLESSLGNVNQLIHKLVQISQMSTEHYQSIEKEIIKTAIRSEDKTIPLRSIIELRKGKDPARLDAIYCALHEGTYPVYSGQTSNEGIFGSIDTFDFWYSNPSALITTVGAQAGTMRIIDGNFSLSQNCALIRSSSEKLKIEFLYYMWSTIWENMKGKIPSDMQPSVRFSDLSNEKILLPNIATQEEVISKLDKCKQQHEYLTMKIHELVQLLREYKLSLVASVATGKYLGNTKVGKK